LKQFSLSGCRGRRIAQSIGLPVGGIKLDNHIEWCYSEIRRSQCLGMG
jgi:hypothetical protein